MSRASGWGSAARSSRPAASRSRPARRHTAARVSRVGTGVSGSAGDLTVKRMWIVGARRDDELRLQLGETDVGIDSVDAKVEPRPPAGFAQLAHSALALLFAAE